MTPSSSAAVNSATVNSGVESATRMRTRNRILDATSQLLSAGERLATSSVNRIAKMAGVSRATFYLHFRSKHELIAALAQREIRPWIDSATNALDNASIDRANLVQVAEGILDVYRAKRGVLAGIIEMAEQDDQTRLAWRETIHSIAQVFQAAIARRRPKLSTAESEQLARMIVWAGERFLHQEAGDSPTETDDVKVWALTEMAWTLIND